MLAMIGTGDVLNGSCTNPHSHFGVGDAPGIVTNYPKYHPSFDNIPCPQQDQMDGDRHVFVIYCRILYGVLFTLVLPAAICCKKKDIVKSKNGDDDAGDVKWLAPFTSAYTAKHYYFETYSIWFRTMVAAVLPTFTTVVMGGDGGSDDDGGDNDEEEGLLSISVMLLFGMVLCCLMYISALYCCQPMHDPKNTGLTRFAIASIVFDAVAYLTALLVLSDKLGWIPGGTTAGQMFASGSVLGVVLGILLSVIAISLFVWSYFLLKKSIAEVKKDEEDESNVA
jgi:hypothetical protein